MPGCYEICVHELGDRNEIASKRENVRINATTL
jgi:hypothetical protein